LGGQRLGFPPRAAFYTTQCKISERSRFNGGKINGG
jgi:hypothetical protein